MKPLSETLTELGIAFTFPIKIKDSNGNITYCEDSDGYSYRREFDVKGNDTYFETSTGYSYRREHDANGDETYCETSDGYKRGIPRSSKTCEGKVVEVEGIKYKRKALWKN